MKTFIFDLVLTVLLIGGICQVASGWACFCLIALVMIFAARWYFLGLEIGEAEVHDAELRCPVLTNLKGF